MSVTVRTAAEIVDALARRRGLVTPIPPYFPLGVSFTAQCVREAYRDVIDVLADAAHRHVGQPEAVAALKAVLGQLSAKVREA